MQDKRTVSRIINSARQALKVSFTSFNLGFGHVTRQHIIDRHTATIAQQLMCDGGKDTVILVLDGTYVYIQVSRYLFTRFSIISRFLEVPEQYISEKVVQSSQEAISVKTNDDRVNDWLHRSMHWSISFRLLHQGCFDDEKHTFGKHREYLGMDSRGRSLVFEYNRLESALSRTILSSSTEASGTPSV